MRTPKPPEKTGLLFLALLLLPMLPVGATVVALLPSGNLAGDSRAAESLDIAFRFELTGIAEVASTRLTRDVLRQRRVRNGDSAAPRDLQAIAQSLGADFLVTATLHDSVRHRVPRLAASARAYSSQDGLLFWAGFSGRSGLDGRTVLGLGEIDSVEELARLTAKDLVASLASALADEPQKDKDRRWHQRSQQLGTVALIPLTSVTAQDALSSAALATELCRSILYRYGFTVVSGNLVQETLRKQRSRTWGEIDADLRSRLHAELAADSIITGAVEAYEIGGSEVEPEPIVAVSLRLLETDTGILRWAEGIERNGWDGQSLFRFGRVYSRGAFLETLLEKTVESLLKETHDK